MGLRIGGFAAFGFAVPIAAAVLTPHQQAASATRPYPAALAGHPFVSQVTPAVMVSTRWDEPQNAPGGCQANLGEVRRNAHGYAELDTTGAAGNCTSIQSPTVTATKPGMVYEAEYGMRLASGSGRHLSVTRIKRLASYCPAQSSGAGQRRARPERHSIRLLEGGPVRADHVHDAVGDVAGRAVEPHPVAAGELGEE